MSRLSRYIHLFEREGHCYLYAPLSNGFAELDRGTYAHLQTLQNSESEGNSFDRETEALLRKLKVIDVDEEKEKNRYRFNIMSRRFNLNSLNLTINPTLSCNFACPYCFESSHPALFMTDEVEDDIISFIKSHKKITHLNVTWFGGEPLLAFDRIVSLTKKMQALGLSYSAGMITNGYLLTEEKLAKFKELTISSVQITIDGNEETHNSRRFLKSGGDTYQRIMSNLEKVGKLAPDTRFSIRVNIDRTNEQEYFEVYKTFRDKAIPNVSVSPGFVNDSDENPNPCVCDSIAKSAFLKKAYYRYGQYNDIFYPSAEVSVCGVRNPNAVVIGPVGELYKCWNDVGDFSRSYGTLRKGITNEAILLEYLAGADHLADPDCNACIFLTRCDGGCPYNRIKDMKKGRKNSSCSLFKENIEDFLLIRNDYREKCR